MALDFSAGGTGDYIEAASAPAISGAFTLAALARPVTSLNSGTILGVGASSGGDYIALAMLDTGLPFFETSSPSVDANGPTTAAADTWCHVAGVQSTTTNRVCYLNGVAGTANTGSSNPTTMDRITVGQLRINGGLVSVWNGDAAEAAIWTAALTAAEIGMLSAGFSPLFVRPSALVFYAPLLGSAAGPEKDLRGGRPLVYGSGQEPSPVPHPRVFGYKPFRPYDYPAAVAAAQPPSLVMAPMRG